MDEDLSNRASILPWIWVIEALAHFKQVDVSVLHGILESKSIQKIKKKLIIVIVYFLDYLFNQSFSQRLQFGDVT